MRIAAIQYRPPLIFSLTEITIGVGVEGRTWYGLSSLVVVYRFLVHIYRIIVYN